MKQRTVVGCDNQSSMEFYRPGSLTFPSSLPPPPALIVKVKELKCPLILLVFSTTSEQRHCHPKVSSPRA